MPNGFLGGTMEIALITVGLLTGVLSIGREVQLMYWPARTTERKLFWVFTRIALVLALGVLYADERSKVASLMQKQESPNFSGEVVQTLWFKMKHKQKLNGPLVTTAAIALFAVVRNTGAPSVVARWKLTVRPFEAAPIEIDRGMTMPDKLVIPGKDPSPPFQLFKKDGLMDKTSESPIAMGAAVHGVLLFELDKSVDAEKLAEGKNTIDLSFRDINGKEYHIYQNGAVTGEPLNIPGLESGPFDPEDHKH